MGKRYYLAYGSNLNVQQMRYRCPSARVIGTGMLEGYRLMFKGSLSGSYLTVEPFSGGSVPVVAWEVSAADEAALDHYEGFPRFYYKRDMKQVIKSIRNGKAKALDVFLYVMQDDRKYGVPSQRYVNVCRQGYAAFGFDQRILTKALNASAMEVYL